TPLLTVLSAMATSILLTPERFFVILATSLSQGGRARKEKCPDADSEDGAGNPAATNCRPSTLTTFRIDWPGWRSAKSACASSRVERATRAALVASLSCRRQMHPRALALKMAEGSLEKQGSNLRPADQESE